CARTAPRRSSPWLTILPAACTPPRRRATLAARARSGRRAEHLPPVESTLMCGIVGYVGSDRSLEVLLGGLKRLEYRGYDSAGVAVIDANDGSLNVAKRA